MITTVDTFLLDTGVTGVGCVKLVSLLQQAITSTGPQGTLQYNWTRRGSIASLLYEVGDIYVF